MWCQQHRTRLTRTECGHDDSASVVDRSGIVKGPLPEPHDQVVQIKDLASVPDYGPLKSIAVCSFDPRGAHNLAAVVDVLGFGMGTAQRAQVLQPAV